MKKQSMFGVGPRIGMIAIPWFAATLVLTLLYPGLFCFAPAAQGPLRIAGIVLAAAGAVFYAASGKRLVKGIRNGELITTGTYYLCQNPLYTGVLFMILPGVSLILNSWLMLTTCAVAYIILKILIRKEYVEMESIFGEAYLEYRRSTPEVFPFPVRKWFGKQARH